jgi:hypothetical protein
MNNPNRATERSTSSADADERSTTKARALSSSGQLDVIPLAHKHRFGWLASARWLILPAGEFVAKNANWGRGLDGYPHPVASYCYHGNRDAVADDDFLSGFPT